MRILLRTPKFLGDVVMITPALDLLRAAVPEAQFWFWGPQFNRELFAREKNYGGSLVHPDRKDLRGQLTLISSIRREKFDASILFASQFRDAAICRLVGIPRVVGTIKRDTGFLLHAGLRQDPVRHRANHFALLAEAAFASGSHSIPRMRLEPRTVDPFGNAGRPRIAVQLGGPRKGTRAYPPEFAAPLIQQLLDLSADVFVLGDSSDAEASAQWLPRTQHPRIHQLAGQTSIDGLMETISALDAVITIDAGVLHLTAALNVPFVSLVGFGTSPYCTVRPLGSRGTHLLPPDEVLHDRDWIRSIPPQRVIDAVQALLATKS